METYDTCTSGDMFERAQKSLAGGVGSVARSPLAGFSPCPIYFERGEGARIYDVDGNEYIDFALGFGPLLLGHRHPHLLETVDRVTHERGTAFGLCHDLEIEAAEKVVSHLPSVDLVRFGNSGTEVVMAVLRLARAFTGREKILRFEGHYHGWSDVIHWNTRSPMGAIGLPNAPRRVPGTSGIPERYGESLVIAPWNDPENLERIVERHADEIAAIITEPMMCNLGATTAQEGYLEFLRELCDDFEILLIFDEVITAFRLGLSGAQGLYGVTPDLTTMAKALGGGYPVAAFGGRQEIMELTALHRVSHAGTYNTNLLCMAAVKGTLEVLEREGTYEHLFALGDRLRDGLVDVIHDAGLPAVAQGIGPVLQIWFEEEPIVNYRDAKRRTGGAIYTQFAHAMHKRGVMYNASQMGVWYVSTAHTEADIDRALEIAEDAIQEVKAQL